MSPEQAEGVQWRTEAELIWSLADWAVCSSTCHRC